MEQSTVTEQQHYDILVNSLSPLGKKYRAIFEIRHFQNDKAAKLLIQSFDKLDNSELLKHEVAYALGQINAQDKDYIKKFLHQVVENEKEFPIVRHEAAEALSNYAEDNLSILPFFEKYAQSSVPELRDTCLIAVDKLKTYPQLKQRYGKQFPDSKEPAAPFSKEEIAEALQLEGKLNNITIQKIIEYVQKQETTIFNKYRALYYLRNVASEEAILAMASFLDRKSPVNSVLFKHEICFVLGQLGEDAKKALDQLKITINDLEENEIVRHEALSAYSSISYEQPFLKQFINDKSRVVRESAIVSLDMIDYWKQ